MSETGITEELLKSIRETIISKLPDYAIHVLWIDVNVQNNHLCMFGRINTSTLSTTPQCEAFVRMLK